MVLDDVGVELAEDGPVVGHQSDEATGHSRQLLLAEGQTWGHLKWGRPSRRDGLLVELNDPPLDQVPDPVVGVLHLGDLVRQGLDGGLGQGSFALRGQVVVDVLDNLESDIRQNPE